MLFISESADIGLTVDATYFVKKINPMKISLCTLIWLAILGLVGCETPKTNSTFTKGEIMEYAPIVLKDSVSEETFLNLSEALQSDFLIKQQGFIRRMLVKKSDREYIDIIVWDSQENADRAIEQSMQSKACENFFSCMQNLESGNIAHYKILAEYGQ
jgi:hypothetical protein